VSDFTAAEWERVERQLAQARRLESLGQLAGGIAHDFNNLIGAILNYASFVRAEVERAEGEQWPAVARDVHQIELAAERASQLTRQLLAFARQEMTRPEALRLDEVVVGLAPILRHTLGEGIELAVLPAAGVEIVEADRGQIEQVLLNLAMNARDAMPDGGTLTIETANVTVDAAYAAGSPGLRKGEYVRLRVGDTGTGMGQDVAERAFEPFFTTKPDASGMGLATVYGIISQAGGDTRIQSEPGVGTSLVVLLPVAEGRRFTEVDDHRASDADADATVLVVEDDDLMRDVTTRILTGHGYRVLAASNGADAIEAVRGHKGGIDLLLTDVVMPVMRGKELAERVVALRPATRVVFMSGYAVPVLGSKGALDPGVDLIDKPFTEQVLLRRVRAALEGET
jgi:nitrogen-specific signal transduction histidine kinase